MSSDESWLVTGINGCIGAWVGLTLAKEDKRVVGLDRSDRNYRLRLICTPEQLARIGVVNGDVADLDLVLPHNAAGLSDGAHDIAAQASAAWEAAVCWDDEYAVERLAEVRAV